MPKILECTVKQITKHSNVRNAYAVATSRLQKLGYLKHGTQKLTAKGKRASAKL